MRDKTLFHVLKKFIRDMLRLPEIWEIIQVHLPRKHWVSLDEIYDLVERRAALDEEDFEPQAPTSDIPKWKRNVRNVLQYRKGKREILWDGHANYKLP